MFKSITKSKANLSVSKTTKDQSNSSCLIAKGTTIEGKFNSTDDVRVDGIIKGDVSCQNQLLVGATGWIEGTIRTQEATIRGQIKGDLPELRGSSPCKNIKNALAEYYCGTVAAAFVFRRKCERA